MADHRHLIPGGSAPAQLFLLYHPESVRRTPQLRRWSFRGEDVRRGWTDPVTGVYYPEGARVGEVLVDGPANTGKSWGVGEFLYAMGRAYPGSRVLFLRMTRKSLSESFLNTWETKVLGPGHPMLTPPRSRTHRDKYVDPETGSEFVIGGLDNEDKIFSAEYDCIYINEAREMVLQSKWESLKRALRNGVWPRSLLIGDTNPGAPSHFLNQRCIARDGRPAQTLRLWSRHEDNPWIREPRGRQHMADLERLVGVQYDRLYLGLWRAAEGLVWPTYRPEINRVYEHLCPPRHTYVGGFDFGHNAPGALVVAGVDASQYLYVELEWYRRGMLMDWWAAKIAEADARVGRRLTTVYADAADPRGIEQLNAHLRRMGCRTRVVKVAKRKDPNKGRGFREWSHSLVRELFHHRDEYRPARLYLCFGSIQEPEKELSDEGLPYDLHTELEQYQYREPSENRRVDEEIAPGCQDHACSAIKYLCAMVAARELWGWQDEDEQYAPDAAYNVLGHADVRRPDRAAAQGLGAAGDLPW